MSKSKGYVDKIEEAIIEIKNIREKKIKKRKKEYEEIESYIKNEAEEFSSFCSKLYKELPVLLETFRQ